MPAAKFDPIAREAEHSLDVGFRRFHVGLSFLVFLEPYETLSWVLQNAPPDWPTHNNKISRSEATSIATNAAERAIQTTGPVAKFASRRPKPVEIHRVLEDETRQ
jgi:hypothetical protein